MLLRHALYMPKPFQTMLDKLLFNWCYPNSITYVIILYPIHIILFEKLSVAF
uniref:Uncharacterized protein n=1 Tax=Arundo donax TaxID=35708 RepID=A0A0A9DXE4_ARUDO